MVVHDSGTTGHTPFIRHRAVLSEVLATLYMALITGIAVTTGPFFLLFPELGALSYEVLGRPHGRWSSAPQHLATSPALAGVIGIMVTRHLPYGPLSVLLTVTSILILISILRSPIGPAISAGVLPLALGITNWWYPPAILFGCSLLTVVLFGWKRIAFPHPPEEPPTLVSSGAASAGAGEEPPPSILWRAGPTLLFTLAIVMLMLVTGLRFLLYPPLVVITYEMFSHPQSCPWAQKPLRLPVACFFTSLMGFGFYCLWGVSVWTTLGSLASGMAALRLLALRVPPALAVGLLPLVIESPTIAYPFSVGIGTALLSGWFLAWQAWAPQIRAWVGPMSATPAALSLDGEEQ